VLLRSILLEKNIHSLPQGNCIIHGPIMAGFLIILFGLESQHEHERE